ncbi:MAG: hypothetical protein ACXW2P_11660, partial [Thermoanaerobaculia bacterium]
AIAIYLVATTPRTSEGIRLPLPASQRELLASVPADADAFALIPTAAAAWKRFESNPITSEAAATWKRDAQLPRPWMLGGADLVMWRLDDANHYAFRLDPFRAFVVRAYLRFSTADARVEGSTFVFGPKTAGPPMAETVLTSLLDLAVALPHGDALVVQKGDAQMFPPIARPAVSVVSVGEREINIVSRARDRESTPKPPRSVSLPRGALLSAWFGAPPRIVGDVDRLIPGKISTLLGDAGSFILYEVESGRLLPRPRGLFVVPATPEARSSAEQIRGVAELVGEVEVREDKILIALDQSSIPVYDREQFSDLSFPATEWALRIDAARMVPVLHRLGDNLALRFAAPRVYRSVRNLRGWIGHLERAGTIDAALAAGAGEEELRVRISSK